MFMYLYVCTDHSYIVINWDHMHLYTNEMVRLYVRPFDFFSQTHVSWCISLSKDTSNFLPFRCQRRCCYFPIALGSPVEDLERSAGATSQDAWLAGWSHKSFYQDKYDWKILEALLMRMWLSIPVWLWHVNLDVKLRWLHWALKFEKSEDADRMSTCGILCSQVSMSFGANAFSIRPWAGW